MSKNILIKINSFGQGSPAFQKREGDPIHARQPKSFTECYNSSNLR